MSSAYTPPMQALIDALGRLPGIGPKSAQRIAFHLLKVERQEVERLASALVEAKGTVRFCDRCFNFAETTLCRICADDRRDSSVICVVEESRDLVAIEKTGQFKGKYHVLLGAMNPLEGVGAEGDVTAMYLARLLKPLGIKVTRIASGLPVGGDLEYADEITLGRALDGRREISG